MNVPWISKERIASRAMNLMEDFQVIAGYRVRPPIPVEDIIERSLGLRLLYEDLEKVLGSNDVLGATYVVSRVICINERLFEHSSEGRLVFTCAHEVGHWVLHRQYVDVQGRRNSKGEAIVCRLRDAKEPIEWQVDYFAACLLMPEKEIREAFQKVCGPEPFVINNVRSAVEKGSRCAEPFVEQWPFIAAAMCEAGGFSNVSKQAMIIRLQDLGLLINQTTTKMDWQALCSNV
ncbi:MAG: ImmA/IrrE family metallo-endopeptidase [Desulfobacteraceae bacterium]|nr:ImmA/IrrE family metallo-endopeptidase [Desulfobacteraceae bacterium]